MDPETRELARAAVEALQVMAANSSNRLGDIVGLIQCGLIGLRAVDHAQRQRRQGRASKIPAEISRAARQLYWPILEPAYVSKAPGFGNSCVTANEKLRFVSARRIIWFRSASA